MDLVCSLCLKESIEIGIVLGEKMIYIGSNCLRKIKNGNPLLFLPKSKLLFHRCKECGIIFRCSEHCSRNWESERCICNNCDSSTDSEWNKKCKDVYYG